MGGRFPARISSRAVGAIGHRDRTPATLRPVPPAHLLHEGIETKGIGIRTKASSSRRVASDNEPPSKASTQTGDGSAAQGGEDGTASPQPEAAGNRERVAAGESEDEKLLTALLRLAKSRDRKTLDALDALARYRQLTGEADQLYERGLEEEGHGRRHSAAVLYEEALDKKREALHGFDRGPGTAAEWLYEAEHMVEVPEDDKDRIEPVSTDDDSVTVKIRSSALTNPASRAELIVERAGKYWRIRLKNPHRRGRLRRSNIETQAVRVEWKRLSWEIRHRSDKPAEVGVRTWNPLPNPWGKRGGKERKRSVGDDVRTLAAGVVNKDTRFELLRNRLARSGLNLSVSNISKLIHPRAESRKRLGRVRKRRK